MLKILGIVNWLLVILNIACMAFIIMAGIKIINNPVPIFTQAQLENIQLEECIEDEDYLDYLQEIENAD